MALAKDQYAAARSSARYLDDKAAGVVNAVAGGTGLLGLGALVLATNPAVPWVAVVSVLPAVGAAFLAVWYATKARKTAPAPDPPGVPGAVAWAAHYQKRYGDQAKGAAEAAFAGHWHYATMRSAPVIAEKARCVDWAMRWLLVTVGLLSVPLVTTLAYRAGGWPASPTLVVTAGP